MKSEAVYPNPFQLRAVDRYWSTTACLLGNMSKIQNQLLYFSFIVLSKTIYSSSLHEFAQIRCLFKYIDTVSMFIGSSTCRTSRYSSDIWYSNFNEVSSEKWNGVTRPDLRILTNFNFVQKLWYNDFFCQLQHSFIHPSWQSICWKVLSYAVTHQIVTILQMMWHDTQHVEDFLF